MHNQPFIASATSLKSVADIYGDHHGWLTGWLAKKTGCKHQAADLTQDTFMRFLQQPAHEKTQEIREPRAYLTTIARRVLSNFYKRQSLEQAYLEALKQLPENITLSAEDILIIQQTLYQIDTMLDGLPIKVRRAFLLSQLEGMHYANIAIELNVSERTVKRYMTQAFEQCLTLMD
jgi:RNA polymerase sigma factor (sigma-70 family)